MQSLVTQIPADRIVDWDSFHAVFADCLGFPGYYGANMNAWIDCLTCADDADAGMISRPVASGELLTLQIDNAAAFAKRCPEQYEALVECAAFVNYRRVEVGHPPVLALLMIGSF
ncbi:MAG: barnase inhibitor [Caulobacteraceae bacterium]|nr:MAG: barnase inhibitor [Caulobacteraceae bacterium]